MQRLLQMKGASGGRNYDLPDGKNCHLAISPPFPSDMNGKAIIGKDRMTKIGDFSAPLVDVEYALQEVQRIRRSEVDFAVSKGRKGRPEKISQTSFFQSGYALHPSQGGRA
jgi:hypothetical protein